MTKTVKYTLTYSSVCLFMQALELIKKSWIISTAVAVMTLFNVSIHATILSVALDGSQPYTSIQTAINASAHGDTVLVYPGRYFENVRFNGRNITLASLEYCTGNRDYVYSTIIDAQQNGVGIRVADNETNIKIQGFTVTNGTGNYNEMYDWYTGGGISVARMSGQRSAKIINCHVTGNRADNGAGIYLGPIQAFLSGVSIHNNSGRAGAGIYFAGSLTQYTTVFDSANRCSIYSNFGAFGSDLFFSEVGATHVVVDTFTVSNPWNFYASAVSSDINTINPFTFDILNTVHQEVNHDLYVAPWGDDLNSGLSPAEPMRSIFMAMYRIASDSEIPKTVHVANGHYSTSLNEQLFPIPVKSHARLLGESKHGVIIDAEGDQYNVFISPYTTDWQLCSLALINGRRGISLSRSGEYVIKNVLIKDVTDVYSASGINNYRGFGENELQDIVIDSVTSSSMSTAYHDLQMSGSIVLKRLEISSCTSTTWLPVLQISTINECSVFIDGSDIHGNMSFSPDVINTLFQISPYDQYATRLRVDIRNSAFYDNYQARYDQMGMARSLNDTLFISNCTFAGNTGGSATIAVQGTSVLTNNVFHNPAMNTQILIPNYISSGINSHTTLRHNNILGGTSGVYNATPANPLIWGEGNTAYDPMFTYEGNRPYTLSPGSPLIDIGWQAALAEPGFDAGGNERLWDGDGDGIAIIDKGAYEYQPIFNPVNLSAELWNSQVLLSWDMPQNTSFIPSTSVPSPTSVIPAEAGIQPFTRGLSGYRVYRNGQPHADIEGAGNSWFRERITEPDTLVYRVAALYGNVESALSDSVVVIVTHVDSSDDLAPSLPSLSVGPNPFTDLAVIRYTLPQAAKVELKIYNLRGQLVRTLDSGIKTAGEQITAWEGCDDRAQALASGVYLLRMSVHASDESTRDQVLQTKIVLVK